MILFFEGTGGKVIAVGTKEILNNNNLEKLTWLFNGATFSSSEKIDGVFVGPRREMVTPWSTNAVEITQNMGVFGIQRIEEFTRVEDEKADHDPMLQRIYTSLDQKIFTIEKNPDPVMLIDDIAAYNKQEGLALSDEEIQYLEELQGKLGRELTDSEIFGFSQVNSEHCRHKIFNGIFIIDGKEKKQSLFQLIKLTTKENPNRVVSAYKDNCAFLQGPVVEQFAPYTQNKPDYFRVKDFESVISLKAETHNFPTTVEPFNGAATGTGGEIRDRVGGGKGAFPLAGTAVYMTSYPRLAGGRDWEKRFTERKWLYQTPAEILVKASNGASDFGNKFGQPLICGSVLTFEHEEHQKKYGFDKVIMLAGGIGYGKKSDSLKEVPEPGDKIVLLGGENYRIGMGGGAVSSVATGEYENAIELNAVQRSNPEMQKRAYNAIRAMGEADDNPVVSIHDHGAGGHLNCLSELVEEPGGIIELDKLPVGDPTLSSKEIVGNESQERMGLVLKDKDLQLLNEVAGRERAPMYVIGRITGDKNFTFVHQKTGEKPIDLKLIDMFGNPPRTILKDNSSKIEFAPVTYQQDEIDHYLDQVLQLEAVACKDWLTNKVDRSVTGKVVKQQTAGEMQLPLNNVAVVALDYQGIKGVATAIGHAPVASLVDPARASILAITESLTNIIWAPLEDGLKSISLSANWMWPAKNPGENYRLYSAVEAASSFARELGINIPTGKDSLSMTQKYKNGDVVYAPGTVIISAAGEVSDIKKTVEPVLVNDTSTRLIYVKLSNDEYSLGGSSFAQTQNKLGEDVPTVNNPAYLVKTFNLVQQLIKEGKIMAGHDVSSGGLITTLLEMNFSNKNGGMQLDLSALNDDPVKTLFNENPALVIQVKSIESIKGAFDKAGVEFSPIGKPADNRLVELKFHGKNYHFNIDTLRDTWFKTSYLLDQEQSGKKLALERFKNYKNQPLEYLFPASFDGKFKSMGIDPTRREKSNVKAAIIREKGVNGDREMAWMMHLAGFDVKDVHMTDLITGRETLEDLNMIVFVGGFSNSDVLGSAKGWAGAFLYNPKAKKALDDFYKRDDTLSLGICNGCQLMIELDLVKTAGVDKPSMAINESGKFESKFLNVDILENKSVMLKSLAGSKLGIWVAHGEGKFIMNNPEKDYNIPVKYTYHGYPANPNGSPFDTAALCSDDGRHLVMMPHLERAIYPWNWAHYPSERKNDEVSPWIEAFVNAREWVKNTREAGNR